MLPIEKIISEIKNGKKGVLLDPGIRANLKAIAKWEKNIGYKLPSDYKSYLTEVGECILHSNSPNDKNNGVKLMGLKDVQQYVTLFPDTDIVIPKSWITIADMRDGNYVVMDLATVNGIKVRIIDGFGEDIGFEMQIIAESFSEFLTNALKDPRMSSGGGGGRKFWSIGAPDHGSVSLDA